MSSYSNVAIAAFLRAEFRRVPIGNGGCLLDLGCGSRPYSAFYRDRFARCVAGDVDIRTSALDVRLNAQSLPFVDESFDLVLFSEVVEHLTDSSAAIAEIRRVLKPGGLLLITWPFNYMLHELPHDYVRYSEYGMARLLNEHGLQVEAFVRRGNVLVLAVVLCEFLISGLLTGLTRLPLVGRLLRPFQVALMSGLFHLPYRAYFVARGIAALAYRAMPGEGLKGPLGHMSHWTLGYCARVRKPM